MHLSPASNRRRLGAGIALVASPILLSIGDAARLLDLLSSGLRGVSAIAVLAMAPAILAIVHLLRSRADRLGLTGGVLCFVGLFSAARMSSLFQLEGVLRAGVDGVPADAVQLAYAADLTLPMSIYPFGLCFPFGLIVLGATIAWTGAVDRWIGVVLLLGGVFFPIGRAIGIEWALVTSDVLLVVALTTLGWRVLTRPEAWTSEAEPGAVALGQGTLNSLQRPAERHHARLGGGRTNA